MARSRAASSTMRPVSPQTASRTPWTHAEGNCQIIELLSAWAWSPVLVMVQARARCGEHRALTSAITGAPCPVGDRLSGRRCRAGSADAERDQEGQGDPAGDGEDGGLDALGGGGPQSFPGESVGAGVGKQDQEGKADHCANSGTGGDDA